MRTILFLTGRAGINSSGSEQILEDKWIDLQATLVVKVGDHARLVLRPDCSAFAGACCRLSGKFS